jgi:Sulfotransferase domain
MKLLTNYMRGPRISNGLARALHRFESASKTPNETHKAWQRLASALSKLFAGQRDAPKDIHPRLAPLPMNVGEAILQTAIAQLVNQRVLSGFYRERLVLLATQEKSSSTLHEVCINEMLHHSANISIFVPTPRQHIAGPSQMGGGTMFHYSMLLFFPNGGVCRGVFTPCKQNDWLVEELGSRWVVLTRHPADRLVAQYCMRKSELAADTDATDALPVFQRMCHGIELPHTVDDLTSTLSWLAGWAERSKDPRLLVVRYEDMMSDPEEHFSRINAFLFDKPMSAPLLNAIQGHLSQSGEGGALQSGDPSTRTYEKGYSGRVQVWRDYLETDDVAAYNEIVDRFLTFHAASAPLTALYPDLRLT